MDERVLCYKVMPFGLKNAEATHQKLANEMFKDLVGKTIKLYVDDMIIKSKKLKDHATNIAEVFNVLNKVSMKLNPKNAPSGSKLGSSWDT